MLAAALSFGACKKSSHPSNVSNPPVSNAINATFSHQVSVAGNPANPYDSIGILHNIILDSLRNYVVRTNDTSRIGKSAYLNKFLKGYRGINFMPAYNPELEFNICTNYKSVLLNVPFSAEGKAMLQRIANVLEQIQSTQEFSNYAGQIKAIEQEILAGRLFPKEKNYLLIVSSVLRHSGYYWMEEFNNGNVSQTMGLFGFLRKVAGVIAAIGADATTAGYHYFKNSPYDHLVVESAWMSGICGYYTGWW